MRTGNSINRNFKFSMKVTWYTCAMRVNRIVMTKSGKMPFTADNPSETWLLMDFLVSCLL